MLAVEPAVLRDLAALLQERTGLAARAEAHLPLRLALSARLGELGERAPSAAAYLELLRSPAGEEELRRLLPLVTVGKTSFFRDERQFRALRALLPGLLRAARDRGRPAAVWSAGCATGEEPWSIAITAAAAGARPGEIEVLGTDVNPEAVAAAAGGVYEARRVRDVPAGLLARWFEPEGACHRVRPELRRLVADLRTHNLVGPDWPPVPPGGFDAVFCRNVIIYFDAPTTRRLLERFLASIAPGGWLFLGYSESLFRLFDGFELVELEGAFVYRRPPEEGGTRPVPRGEPPHAEGRAPPAAGAPLAAGPLPPPPAAPAPGAAPPREPATPPAAVPHAPQEVLAEVASLLARGGFEEARAALEAQLAGGDHLGLRLTLANLYGLLRRTEAARACFAAAVAAEPLSAEAHLFYGVHLLDAGDADGAARELSRALFLDPDLAIGHYFLGRCREAQRDAFRARLCYRNAVDAWSRLPEGTRHPFLGHYPDLPGDGGAWARAAEHALGAL
jgi:chemotaxis protein methyltransferase CheR